MKWSRYYVINSNDYVPKWLVYVLMYFELSFYVHHNDLRMYKCIMLSHNLFFFLQKKNTNLYLGGLSLYLPHNDFSMLKN